MWKRLLSNQRGLTLIELLVVIVILGIIVAIAIPLIGNIIDNTKKDAHIANAQQIAAAAKMYAVTEGELADNTTITLAKLQTENYLDDIKDPSSNKTYDKDQTRVVIEGGENAPYKYKVTLVGNGKTYIKGDRDVNELTRDDVNLDGHSSS
ncbi:hypothetical protein CathTA2_2955 [Caldalkalibacillus thermarum TA2.A1]|uniref:Prepilin-type N-terminal cleavage/methylation domain-containing protein n=1 Tax=Caldalkalibacillus thermarum (strain TA2.A1) TaxID=986075 RepID=F5LAM0_CALTT|nr:prepilin-type N-terminal cleavage/methylation domain-containing protein [Caldalkalibacillus thermarum]EGL81592.1 hypothetical protein CathTA2_2955 [Caldalkalibacillus thermarum TA2.A1]QZT33518.1 prepilin-type N-terminal cleavage/methylation domain-containing protein [Caldalkalibacillus thermarum TA2.A1]